MRKELQALDKRHDHLTERLRERLAGRREADGLVPTYIPDEIALEAVRLIMDLSRSGKFLYDHDDRDRALSLMSFWIHALYRAQWYQKHDKAPHVPELEDFDPSQKSAMTDSDYPFPRLDLVEEEAEDKEEMRKFWSRLSRTGRSLLLRRRLIGVTGAQGSGRSHFIEYGLRHEVMSAEGESDLEYRRLSPVDEFDADGKPEVQGDRRFLSPLVELAAKGPKSPELAIDEALLEQDPGLLARILAAQKRRCMIVVHDLEKLWTRGEDMTDPVPSPAQRCFMEALFQVAMDDSARHLVVIDLQRNFLGRLKAFGEFKAALDSIQDLQAGGADSAGINDGWIIVSLEPAELHNFIATAAGRAGLDLEAGLLDRLVADHQGEPAAVPLLLFTLRRLWLEMLATHAGEGKRLNMLGWNHYRKVRSGRLALDYAADEAMRAAHSSWEDSGALKESVRVVFMRMIRLLPGGEYRIAETTSDEVMRVLARSKYLRDMRPGGIREMFDMIVREFTQTGILVKEGPENGNFTLRIVHPALVEGWTPLVNWLELERDQFKLYWLLKADAREWQQYRDGKHGRGIHAKMDAYALLWRGTKLQEASKMDRAKDLEDRETRFITRSRIMARVTKVGCVVGLLAPIICGVVVLMWGYERLGDREEALYLERGANAEAVGDLSTAGAYFGKAQSSGRMHLFRFFREHLFLPRQREKAEARKDAKNLAAKLAFDRFPQLAGYATAEDELSVADFSDDGELVVQGLKPPGKKPGSARLWRPALSGTEAVYTTLVIPEEYAPKPNVVKVSFLHSRPGETPDKRKLVAVACSTDEGKRGWVGIWNVAPEALASGGNKALPCSWSKSFDLPVSDMAFKRGDAKENNGNCLLVVGFGRRETGAMEVPGDPVKTSAGAGDQVVGTDGCLARLFTVGLDLSRQEDEGTPIYPPGRSSQSALVRLALLELDGGTVACATSTPNGADHGLFVWRSKPEKPAKAQEVAKSGEPESNLPKPRGLVADLSFSPDGKVLAVGSTSRDEQSGFLQLFDSDKIGAPAICQPIEQPAGITRIAFSPGGDLMAVTLNDGTIQILRGNGVRSEIGTRKFPPIQEGTWTFAAAWSPDGRWLATGNRDRYLRIWEVSSGRLAFPPLFHGETVGNPVFSAGGLRLLSTTLSSARVWNVCPLKNKVVPVAGGKRARFARLGGNGLKLAVLDEYEDPTESNEILRELNIWSEKTLAPMKLLTVGQQDVPASNPRFVDIAINNEGTYAAALEEMSGTTLKERKFHFWHLGDAKTEVGASTARAGTSGIKVFSQDGDRLMAFLTGAPASGSVDSLQMIQIEKASVKKTLEQGVRFAIGALDYCPKRNLVAVGGAVSTGPGIVEVYGIQDSAFKLLAVLNGHDEGITSLFFSDDGETLLTGAKDDRVRLFNLAGLGGSESELDAVATGRHTADIVAVAFEKNGGGILSSGKDSTTILWDIVKDRFVPRIKFRHSGPISCQTLSDDGRLLAVGGANEARLWSTIPVEGVETGQLIAVLPHSGQVSSLVFARKEGRAFLRSLATGGEQQDSGSRGVQAQDWELSTDRGNEKSLSRHLEMISGQRVEELRSQPLTALEVRDRLPASVPGRSRAEEHYSLMVDAASAGDWNAAAFHTAHIIGEDNRFFQERRDGGQLALKVALASNNPGLVDRLLKVVDPDLAAAKSGDLTGERIRNLELLGVSKLQFARISEAGERAALLSQAERIFARLAEVQPEEPKYHIRLAEVEVEREKWGDAFERLETARGKLSDMGKKSPFQSGDGKLWLSQARSSIAQRQAEVALMAASPRGKSPTSPGRSADAKSIPRWEDVAEAAIQLEQKIAESGLGGGLGPVEPHYVRNMRSGIRLAWALALGDKGSGAVVDHARWVADAAYDRGGPSSYAALNTFALVHLRAGDALLAENRITAAINDYERKKERIDLPRYEHPGRPMDWVVHALILLKRAEALDPENTDQLVAQAGERIEWVEVCLDQRGVFKQGRATWTSLDLRILADEARLKYERQKPGQAAGADKTRGLR